MAPISVNQLQKGMIIKATYKRKARKGEPAKSKTYMMLILNPEYEGFVHALSMEEFSNKELNELAKKYMVMWVKTPPGFLKLEIPKIRMIDSSQRIYVGTIKKLIGNKLGESYRTFLIKKENERNSNG